MNESKEFEYYTPTEEEVCRAIEIYFSDNYGGLLKPKVRYVIGSGNYKEFEIYYGTPPQEYGVNSFCWLSSNGLIKIEGGITSVELLELIIRFYLPYSNLNKLYKEIKDWKELANLWQIAVKDRDEKFKRQHSTLLSCIDLLGKSGENTKAIVAEKLKGLIE